MENTTTETKEKKKYPPSKSYKRHARAVLNPSLFTRYEKFLEDNNIKESDVLPNMIDYCLKLNGGQMFIKKK